MVFQGFVGLLIICLASDTVQRLKILLVAVGTS